MKGPSVYIWILLSLTLPFSCAVPGLVDLSNWHADSENVTNLTILVEDDGFERFPTPLNDSILIFESFKNDNTDLWAINMNKAGGIIQLTTYDGTDRLAAANPDGQRYSFLSTRSETGYYLGKFGIPTVSSLVEAKKPYFGGWVSGDFTANGSHFIYVSGKYIWTYDMISGTRTQFIQGTDPIWIDDDKRIIYRKIAKEAANGVSTSIWIMDADGTKQTEIITGDLTFSYRGARVSPDGKRILYHKDKAFKRMASDIWICDIDGTNHMQITTHPLMDTDGNWIDNNTIVFVSERPQSGNIKDAKFDIWKAQLY